MKVKCINNDGWENILTIGKTYKVINEDITCYYIINDKGYDMWYTKERFKSTVAEIRNETINKLLEDES